MTEARKFWPLFATQALGALNDNLFKNALVVLALVHLKPGQAGAIAALSGGLFLLPYMLVSAQAGLLADAHDKARLMRLTKLWELGLMVLGAAGFLSGSFSILLAGLVGLGLQAAFFSPLKYGILPDFFAGDALARANGAVEAGTFGGIVLGTLAGGFLVLAPHGAWLTPAAGIGLALTGLIASWFIPPAPAEAPAQKIDWNLWRANRVLLGQARRVPRVWFACGAISWFWALGASVLAAFPVLAKVNLAADGQVVTLLLGVFAVFVGVGSLAAARLVHGGAVLRVALPAGLGMSLFIMDFALQSGHLYTPTVHDLLGRAEGWRFLADLALTAFCGGLFSVPFYVLLQQAAPPAARARMVAANNVLNAVATLLAGGAEAVAYAQGVEAATVLEATAAANLLVMVWIWRRGQRPA